MYGYLITESGAQILKDGVLVWDQPFTPGVEGQVPMDEATATTWATNFIAAATAADTATAG
ncbi:hypothetical protein ACGY1D_13595 [Burkholderia pseudomallei]